MPGRASPELVVELGGTPTTQPHLGTNIWTRIDQTNPLRGWEVNRGARSSYGDQEPAEGSMIFDNNNGFLDPAFAAGPYRDLLTPGRIIRMWFQHPATNAIEVVFGGNVRRFPVQWAGSGFDASTELELVDVLWLMGAAELPESYAIFELLRGVKYRRPSHLFVLREHETTGDVTLADEASDFEASPTGTPEPGDDTLVPFTDIRGLRGGDVTNKGYIGLPLEVAPAPPWTYMIVFRTEPGQGAIGFNDDNILTPNLALRIGEDPAGNGLRAYARIRQGDGSTKFVSTGPILADGQPHLLSMNDSGSELFVYADGVFLGKVAHVGITAPAGGIAVGLGRGASFAMAMIWDERVTETFQKAIWDDIRRPPSAGQFTDQRLDSLIDVTSLIGLPRNYLLGVEAIACLPMRTASLPLLDVVRRTVATGDGRYYADRVGVFQYAHRQITPPAAAIRLYGVGGVPVEDFHVSDGAEDVVTHVTVENEAGVTRTYEDTGASARYGQRRFTIETVNLFPLTMWHRAEREVFLRANPKPYVDEFVLRPVADGVGYVDTLRLDLFNRIDFARRAPYGGPTVTDRLEIVGLRHRSFAAGFADWTTTVRSRPVREQRTRVSIGTTADDGVETPDSAANSLTAGLDLRARFYRNNWRGAGFPMLIGKWFDARAYVLHFDADRPLFEWVTSGGVVIGLTGPSLRRGTSRAIWLRATLKLAAPYQARILLSEDGATWRIIAERNGASTEATSIVDTASPLFVGIEKNGGVYGQPLNGRVLYADGRDSINGPRRFVFDPMTGIRPGGGKPIAGDRSWTSSETGEVYTLRANTVLQAW